MKKLNIAESLPGIKDHSIIHSSVGIEKGGVFLLLEPLSITGVNAGEIVVVWVVFGEVLVAEVVGNAGEEDAVVVAVVVEGGGKGR